MNGPRVALACGSLALGDGGLVGSLARGDGDADWVACQARKLALTRSGNTAGYGNYTIIFTEEGFDSTNSTIMSSPEINPMQTDAPAS